MTRYRDAGVDVGRADAVKHDVIREATSTWTPSVRRLTGGFAGVMDWPASDGTRGASSAASAAGAHAAAGAPPLLAATMDGVGTKLHLALAAGRVADAAADLVYHGANDLLVHGARPLAMLDYVAQARLDPQVVREVVRGLATACRQVGAVLLGGETAEMPDTYLDGVVDVAGCMIGWVDPAALRDGSAVEPGDVVLGLAADGLHTNGFSLARRVLKDSGLALDALLPGGGGVSLGEALLAPHRWYGPALLPELAQSRVRAMAHITGGGIAGNLVRVLPAGCHAVIDGAWPRPAVYRWLCEAGSIPEDDAREAFNLGIGFIVIAAAGSAEALMGDLVSRGERVIRCGVVRADERGVTWSAG